jgi:hypothetical protein
MDSRLPKQLRKHLSGNALICQVRAGVEQMAPPDHQVPISPAPMP